MKSLVLALLLFAVVVYGCYDVKPFRSIRRAIRRIPGGKTGPLRGSTAPLDGPDEAVGAGTGPAANRTNRRGSR